MRMDAVVDKANKKKLTTSQEVSTVEMDYPVYTIDCYRKGPCRVNNRQT